jgi:GH25 family lysozyme M1 (1,4-beta-N-acetylmuramidase)
MTTSGLPAIDVPHNGTPAGGSPGGTRSQSVTAGRPRRAGKAAVAGAPFRFLTANIQSFPEDALTLEQALSDLRLDAADGDLVLLQEIATRYRPLVQEAFPAPEWEVFFGTPDSAEPIAFRTAAFDMVAGEATLLHRAHARLHGRRYITHVQLRDRSTGLEFHVTNLHLVAGAFNNVVEPDQALRIQEWNDGIAKHRRMLEDLVAGGLPIIGGGDYNRQLRKHKSLGTDIAGSAVRYAVDPGSIDLLWVIDGRQAGWNLRGRKVYGSRSSKDPVRNSDHAAREATVMLTTRTRTPASTPAPAPHHPAAAPPPPPVQHLPGPFELTTFGDGTPKKVDWKTRAALEEAEARLGYPLTVVQGSYNAGGVSASAGTHDGGGVIDLLPWDWQRKVHVLRSIGFAAWHRPTIKGLWGEHIHAVMVDHGRLAPAAAQQVVAYRAGRDGLKSNLPDPFWHPAPIPVFSYPPPAPDLTPGSGTAAAGHAATHPPVPPLGPPFPTKRTLDGVDTSHYQSGAIDLRAARHAGVRWWYVKATEGTSFVDPTYERRVQAARAAGIPIGAYHFARPENGDAAAEARHFLGHTDIRPGDMLPMLDLESAEGLSMAELTTWTGTWVRTVTQQLAAAGAVGRPIIYTRFNLGNGFGCLLWVARYSDDFRAPIIPRPWKRAVIWQHSDGRFGPVKSVPGFGAVDANAMHPDVPLSALRLRPATRPGSPGMSTPEPARPRRRRRTPPDGDGDQLRRDLLTAAAKLQAAIESLPKG